MSEIRDETELTACVVVKQRGYVVPKDVADELRLQRERIAELERLLRIANRDYLPEKPASYVDEAEAKFLADVRAILSSQRPEPDTLQVQVPPVEPL